MARLNSLRVSSALVTLVFWSSLRLVLCQYVDSRVIADIGGRQDDGDLHTFITRPDIRSPKFNVSVYRPDQLAPGYLFLAPYDCLECQYAADVFIPQQVGPHIYDRYGNLVWSGANLFHNRPAWDFRPTRIDGADHLTFLASRTNNGSVWTDGAGFVLDSAYQQVLHVRRDGFLDMHEFALLDDGSSAIVSMRRQLSMTNHRTSEDVTVWDHGFQKVDLPHGSKLFEWWSSDHISYDETTFHKNGFVVQDYFHLNSVDVTASGDYLLSARHTDGIYLVSASDGHVIWRLGGTKSDFTLEGFNFSRQHDARVRQEDSDTMTISFLDNAWDGEAAENVYASRSLSSLLIVKLHATDSPTAVLLQRIERPDGKHTYARGNMQLLSNGNWLGYWGDNAYMTEHNEGGELVAEASFLTDRLTNYRAYKFDFSSSPTDWPAIKAFVATDIRAALTTVVYASWDGATEVHSWRIYSVADPDSNDRILIGTAQKTGFETAVVCKGYSLLVFAEAVDVHGASLSISEVVETKHPPGWYGEGYDRQLKGVQLSVGNASASDSQLRNLAISFIAGIAATFMFLQVRRRKCAAILPIGTLSQFTKKS